jgi:branched-chain amino acid transport system substrate-binding protein
MPPAVMFNFRYAHMKTKLALIFILIAALLSGCTPPAPTPLPSQANPLPGIPEDTLAPSTAAPSSVPAIVVVQPSRQPVGQPTRQPNRQPTRALALPFIVSTGHPAGAITPPPAIPVAAPTGQPTPTQVPPTPTVVTPSTPTALPPPGSILTQDGSILLTAAQGWTVTRETDGLIEMQHPPTGLRFGAMWGKVTPSYSLEAILAGYVAMLRDPAKYPQPAPTPTVQEKTEMTLAGGVRAISQVLTGANLGSTQNVTVQLIAARAGEYYFLFTLSGANNDLLANRVLTDRFVQGIQLNPPPAGAPPLTTVKVAVQSPLSNANQSIGASMLNAVELGILQQRSTLRKMGFSVELVAYDDQSKPEIGSLNAGSMSLDPAILCVVGHYDSAVQIASAEVYHSLGLANVSPANSDPAVTARGYAEISRIVGRDDLQGAAAARFAVLQGIKTAFVIQNGTDFGQALAAAFISEAQKGNVALLGFAGTQEKDNFDALLAPVLSANPDLIYFAGLYDQAAGFILQARQKGYPGMIMLPGGLDSPAGPTLPPELLSMGRGTFFTAVTAYPRFIPVAAQFLADYSIRYGSEPLPFAAQAYDAAGICLKAIQNAITDNGGRLPTRAQVAAAVRTLKDYAGVTGTINFDDRGEWIAAPYWIYRFFSGDPSQLGENPLVEQIVLSP